MNRLFSVQKLDSHIVIQIGNLIMLSIKCPAKFNYKKAVEYGLNNKERSPKIILSLTTYPKRILSAAKTINTLLRQTVKPDKLILWLSQKEFPNKENDLPDDILNLKQFGLEIKWCEYMRSYQKLIPSLKEFPNDIIVTADDDMMYEPDWLESLYNAYLKDNNNIYTHRAGRIKLVNQKISFVPHRESLRRDYSAPSFFNTLMGVSGCLYPPNALNNEVLEQKRFENLIPTHDDVWFWATAVLNGTKTSVVDGYKRNLYQIKEVDDFGLRNINNDDPQSEGVSVKHAFKLISEEYPQITDILQGEIGSD